MAPKEPGIFLQLSFQGAVFRGLDRPPWRRGCGPSFFDSKGDITPETGDTWMRFGLHHRNKAVVAAGDKKL